MAKIIDISVELHSESTVWPGSPPFKRTQLRSLARDNANVSAIAMDVHTGTHVDAPLHHIDAGAAINAIPLGSMLGPAQVIDVADKEEIDASLLESSVDKRTTRLLIKTRNSSKWTGTEPFTPHYVALTKDAAVWAAERKLLLIANDYLSIQRPEDGPDIHQILLRSGVVILEGITLADVSPGFYTLLCMPLNIASAEGAPARAALVEGSLDET